jgi:hypothetical protein
MTPEMWLSIVQALQAIIMALIAAWVHIKLGNHKS